jgi:superfamily I DNA/RNA helicase
MRSQRFAVDFHLSPHAAHAAPMSTLGVGTSAEIEEERRLL